MSSGYDPDNSIQPKAIASKAHNIKTHFLASCEQDETSNKTYSTFSQSRQRQHTSAGDFCRLETSRSRAHTVTIPPVLIQRDETCSKTSVKRKVPKKVRFAIPDADSVRNIPEDSACGGETYPENQGAPHHSRKTIGSRTKIPQLRSPKPQITVDSVDNDRPRLVSVKLRPRCMPQDISRNNIPRVLTERNFERDERSPNAVSVPIPIPNPERPVPRATGTPLRVQAHLNRLFLLVRKMPGSNLRPSTPPGGDSGVSLSFESDSSDVSFDENFTMSP